MAPLPALAPLAGVSPQRLQQWLRAARLAPQGDNDGAKSLVGPEPRRQLQVLRQALQPGDGTGSAR